MKTTQIMVGSEAITTAHPTQIRLVKHGSGSRQPRRSMVVVDSGRSMSATAEPAGTAVLDDDVRQLPERNTEPESAVVVEPDIRQIPDLWNDNKRSDQEIERRNRKRKYQSEQVEPASLPRRSKRIRRFRIDNEFEYY
nr:uncharacterized protein LOC115254759 [Aedes albopictus]